MTKKPVKYATYCVAEQQALLSLTQAGWELIESFTDDVIGVGCETMMVPSQTPGTYPQTFSITKSHVTKVTRFVLGMPHTSVLGNLKHQIDLSVQDLKQAELTMKDLTAKNDGLNNSLTLNKVNSEKQINYVAKLHVELKQKEEALEREVKLRAELKKTLLKVKAAIGTLKYDQILSGNHTDLAVEINQDLIAEMSD